jgi:DNA helicase IV
VDVTDVASVKGLEFDYVVVPDASLRAYPDTDEARRRLHVAVTRAAHQLWIAAIGTPSPLLASLRSA